MRLAGKLNFLEVRSGTMKNKSAMPHRLFFIVVGDISFSAGSRTLFRELILAWKRMGIDVQCRIYQLRTDVLPEANADGTVRLKDFPDPVYSPTTKKLFDRLPRQLFRLYERMVIAGCLWRWLREIRAEDRLVLNGCLGLLHLLPIKSPTEHRWWYKVGVIKKRPFQGCGFVSGNGLNRGMPTVWVNEWWFPVLWGNFLNRPTVITGREYLSFPVWLMKSNSISISMHVTHADQKWA